MIYAVQIGSLLPPFVVFCMGASAHWSKDARHKLYKNILQGREKTKVPYGERRRAERTYRRVYNTQADKPQTRTRWKYRRKDTRRHSGVKF